ncbi:MAG TPA: transglutaminase domain-containing protein, partial [Blastocatellia bacterium]|nr:transglutaminase domain-containing protein [Blastocatellia bacterium]
RPTTFYRRLQFQRDVPVQVVKYSIKPWSNPWYGMRVMWMHCTPSPLVKEPGGFHSTSLNNVPAFREEPRMPPEDQVRPWMLIYYSEDKKLEAEKFWKEYGKSSYETFKNQIKVNDDVKKAAAEIVAGATTDEQKLERILTFCRTKIKNIYDDAAGLTDQDRKKMKDNNNTADTLKRGYGLAPDIDLLFAALAQGAGFEARVIRLSDRGDIFFDPSFPDSYFIEDIIDIGVKVNGQWKFYDPSSRYVPAGMLSWRQEGIKGLVTDPKEPMFIDMPVSKSDKSQQKGTAKLRLSEDGTIEGDVRLELTGHFAAQAKERADGESASEREEALKSMVTRHISTAEFADIHIEPNLDDASKPFVYTFKIRVPGYAQKTGKRLFLQPAFFQYGEPALFSASQRKYPIYFSFPWSEVDEVTIELPEGYALDNAESPQPFNANQIAVYNVNIGVTKDMKTLVFKRSFSFDAILFQTDVYGNLKQVFELLHTADSHAITLKQTASTASK